MSIATTAQGGLSEAASKKCQFRQSLEEAAKFASTPIKRATCPRQLRVHVHYRWWFSRGTVECKFYRTQLPTAGLFFQIWMTKTRAKYYFFRVTKVEIVDDDFDN